MDELRETRRRHKEQTMRNIIGRIKYRTAALAMQTWVEMVETAKRNRVAPVEEEVLRWGAILEHELEDEE